MQQLLEELDERRRLANEENDAVSLFFYLHVIKLYNCIIFKIYIFSTYRHPKSQSSSMEGIAITRKLKKKKSWLNSAGTRRCQINIE